MYIDPSLGGFLLEPLYRLQASPTKYTIGYAAPDLGASCINMNIEICYSESIVGSNYPTVSGSNSNHSQGVERLYLCYIFAGCADQFLLIETGNMLIMTYAYARASGDGSLISKYVRQNSSFFLLVMA